MNDQPCILKNWLLKKDEGKNWGWQVIVDTLAIGENLPLRIISYNSLRNLYSNIDDELSKQGRDSLKYESFKSSYPDKLTWDKYVKKVINWATNLENNNKSELEKPNLQILTDLIEIYPLLASKIFPVLPANPFPMEMLSRISFNEYRIYCLLWFYHWIIVKKQTPKDPEVPIYCGKNALSFHTMHMASQWIVDNNQVYGNENNAQKKWLMIIGPSFSGTISMLTEEKYDKETVSPVVKFIENFSKGISQEKLFHKHRFRRAALEAAHLPRMELMRRQLRITDALKLLLEADITALNNTPTRHDLFHMSLLALFSSLRTKEVNEIVKNHDHTLFFDYAEDYISVNKSDKKAHEQVSLAINLGVNNHTQLSVCKKVTLPFIKKKEIEYQIKQYGFILQCNPGDINPQVIDELRALCSRFYLRAYRNNRAQDGIRLMIISDRLHRELGSVNKLETNALEGISSWLSGLLRSESTVLYRYSTHKSSSIPFKAEDRFSRDPKNMEKLNALIRDMEETTQEGLKQSIANRAVNENESKICLMYDPETQQAIPKGNTIFHSINNKDFSFRSAIAVPVRFNGRRQGALVVSAYQPWQFSWGQQVLMEQAASVIAPYFYNCRFLEALGEINTKVLQFHSEPRDEVKLYFAICSDLANMFLCDGASFWVLDKNKQDILKQIGHHNIKIERDYINLNQEGFVTDLLFAVDGINKQFNVLEEKKHNSHETKYFFEQGLKFVALVPLFDQKLRPSQDTEKNKVMGVIMLYARDSIGFKDSWNGIIHYMVGFISFVVKAVISFRQRKEITDLVQHEIRHEVSQLIQSVTIEADLQQRFSRNFNRLNAILQSKKFMEHLTLGEKLGDYRKKDIDLIRDLSDDINNLWNNPKPDINNYANLLTTRINALCDFNNKNNKSSQVNIDHKRLLAELGDEIIVNLILPGFALDGEKKWLNIFSTINHLVNNKNEEITNKGLYFEINVPDDYELLTWPSIMNMVLQNLLENAINYSSKNKAVSFDAKIEKDGSLELSISNIGEAMDDVYECSEIILGKEKRGSNSKGIKGEGLGLYIVHKLCTQILKMDFRLTPEYLSARFKTARYVAAIYIPSNLVKRNAN